MSGGARMLLIGLIIAAGHGAVLGCMFLFGPFGILSSIPVAVPCGWYSAKILDL